MEINALDNFIEKAKQHWAPLSTPTIENYRGLMASLMQTSPEESWLADLLGTLRVPRQLFRDAKQGFGLMCYRENMGVYRPPHNHGSGWVIYAVLRGKVEMGHYRMFIKSEGDVNLVRREAVVLKDGDCHAYLPGDIHDTHCLSESAVIFRFTSCDFALEAQAGRMVRFSKHGRQE